MAFFTSFLARSVSDVRPILIPFDRLTPCADNNIPFCTTGIDGHCGLYRSSITSSRCPFRRTSPLSTLLIQTSPRAIAVPSPGQTSATDRRSCDKLIHSLAKSTSA